LEKVKHRADEYFLSRGWVAFAFQRETWRAFEEGASGLLHAPTGQGKTLAVYLGPLVKTLECKKGLSILWITPLRALAADTLRALREPMAVMAPELQAEARTGDSSSTVKARLRRWVPGLQVWVLSATLGNLEQAAAF
jgi:ATP-dependent Lhr-like helicase